MKNSSTRILTTHVGSMTRPPEVVEALRPKEAGQPYDKKELENRVKNAVATVVKRQAEIGIDIPSDGEFSKSSFSGYANERLSGFEIKPYNSADGPPQLRGRDRKAFAEFYKEYDGTQGTGAGGAAICTGPVAYIGQDIVATDMANLKAALAGLDTEEAFIPAVAPGTMELQRRNEHYATEEEYLYAIADAMHEEYMAIVDGGYILQIDDPRIVTQYDTPDPALSIHEYRKFAELRIDALNHALKGLPEDRVRYHLCWGSWH